MDHETRQNPTRAISEATGEVKEVIEHVGEAVTRDLELVEQQWDEAKDFFGTRARRIALAIGGGLALIAGGTLWALRRRRPSRRPWRDRGMALQRMWRHPELIARPAEPSILRKAGRNLAVIAITTAARKGAGRLVDKAWQ